VKVLGDAIGASAKGNEILGDIERLDGTDAETREWGFVEDAAKKIEKIKAGSKIAAPGA